MQTSNPARNSTVGKHPTEIERHNRMFAIEQAVKLGAAPDRAPVENARDFFDFLQEGTEVTYLPTGFTAE